MDSGRFRLAAGGGWNSGGLASSDLPGSRAFVRERDAEFVVVPQGQPFAVIGFTVARGGFAEIDILADRSDLHELDLTVLDG